MIEDYKFGSIKIQGKVYNKDLVILSDQVFPKWRREDGHNLSEHDLCDVIANKPDILIIGTGMFGRMNVPANLVDILNAKGIQVISARTGKACQLYNQKRNRRKIAAALHLSC